METNKKAKWFCPRCKLWVKEEPGKVCRECKAESRKTAHFVLPDDRKPSSLDDRFAYNDPQSLDVFFH